MIRHPLQSVAGRARPDLNRVADGIAASLRQFSISARRCAADQNGNDGINDDPRQLTGRQRAAAAVQELIATAEAAVDETRNRGPRQFSSAPNHLQSDKPPAFSRAQGQTQGQAQAQAQGPAIITTPQGFKGVQRVVFGGNGGDVPVRSSNGPNIIRGGFRGRGGGSFARGGAQGGGGGGFGGNTTGRDDRPSRRGRRRRRGDDREGRSGRRRDGKEEEQEEEETGLDSFPKIKAYLEMRETGETMTYNPSLSLESLAGWGPGLATSATPFAHSEAVIRQCRVLGGGYAYDPAHLVDPNVLRKAYAEGPGVFIAPSEEARQWMGSVFTYKYYWRGEKVRIARFLKRAPEVGTAVLEDVLLGKYEGPKYVDATNTLGVLTSYVKRDSTWNVAAERSLEAKVAGLIAPPAKQGGAKEARA
ncbi:uncharacterized protein F4807DRAFT_97779 [Annulohypoxylon truncatum]|uniref:uncharacterized protein n=1 Tax=Annulohypoxylon truncatum TaxID=327061 RepID=UPI0020088C2B|nr:uncharacterized protein F4807DRAFT_97779 [Annulohypoxylon truncatum]KAI1209120.1 hypothetical protein F4807DRAFT_97779 [Annulohypoxylon truncatum]